MENFKQDFENICKEDMKDACLIGLSALVLKNISEIESKKLGIIKEVFCTLDHELPEIKKITGMFNIVEEYDKRLIDILVTIERDISIALFDKNEGDKCCNNKQQDDKLCNIDRDAKIKKWWEV